MSDCQSLMYDIGTHYVKHFQAMWNVGYVILLAVSFIFPYFIFWPFIFSDERTMVLQNTFLYWVFSAERLPCVTFFIIPFLCSFFFAFIRGGGVNNHKDYMIAIINNIKFRLIAELHTHFEFWNYKRVQYRIKRLECFKVNKKCSIKYLGLFVFCSLLWLYANSAFKMLAIGHRLHYFKWDMYIPLFWEYSKWIDFIELIFFHKTIGMFPKDIKDWIQSADSGLFEIRYVKKNINWYWNQT